MLLPHLALRPRLHGERGGDASGFEFSQSFHPPHGRPQQTGGPLKFSVDRSPGSRPAAGGVSGKRCTPPPLEQLQ